MTLDMSNTTHFDPVYHKLASVLDTIPNGFPPVEDHTHLKILAKIFELDEANIASKLTLTGDTVEKISKKVDLSVDELTAKLELMVDKGQIRSVESKKGKKYGLMPFVVGIYEEQLHRLDRELAELVEHYFNINKGEELFTKKPALHRIIPVNIAIESKLNIHTYSEAQEIVNTAKSWGVRTCICRKQQALVNNPCAYPIDACLIFSKKENAFNDSKSTRPITKEESFEILAKAEQAGLIHSTMNVREGVEYICNCCTCCCGILQGLIKWNQPYAFVSSNYIIQLKDELCIGCEKCIERCKFGALTLEEGKCLAIPDRCIGCGVCTIVCPTQALKLVSRAKKDIKKPPKDIVWWMIKRAIRRMKNIFKIL